MAISKLILNGVTQMDITDTTATADKILSSYGAYGADGTWMDGVASMSGGLEYEMGVFEPEEDVVRPTITFANTHAIAPFYVLISDSTGTYYTTSDSSYAMIFSDFGQINGGTVEGSGGLTRYGDLRSFYRGTSLEGLTVVNNVFYTPSTDSRDSSTSYMRYWVTETCFYPYTNNSSRYWRAGRTYKWLAIWAPVRNSV